MKYNIVYSCIKLETYRFCRYRKDSVIIGSVDDICGAFFTQVLEESILLEYPTKKKRSRI